MDSNIDVLITVNDLLMGVYINGIEGFWSFAKERLMKYHGVNPAKFPLYLKELEFRYNHRDRDLFADLLQVLVGYNSVACTE